MKIQYAFCMLILILALIACQRKSNTQGINQELHESCYLKHDPGPCRMNIKRYYYDTKDKKCKEFIYGGCDGVVPFKTLEGCKEKCNCQ